jgi:hypothetical protein
MNRSRTIRPMLALATTLALAAPALAAPNDYAVRGGSYPHDAVDGNVVDVQVLVDGASAPLYFRPGTSDRHYFQAFKGRNYSLLVKNTTGRRVGVLIAVDGLNVVSGEQSKLDRHEQMYVLDPYESADIQGWRTSLDHVRRFVFVDEERSYAERTGQANGDMGWIRVVAFREVEQRSWWDRARRGHVSDERRIDGGAPMSDAAPAPRESEKSTLPRMEAAPPMSAQGYNDAPQGAPGTGWGDKRYDPVQQTSFQAESWAADQITLRYEYANGLRALGISPRELRNRVYQRDRGQYGFAQPPRW